MEDRKKKIIILTSVLLIILVITILLIIKLITLNNNETIEVNNDGEINNIAQEENVIENNEINNEVANEVNNTVNEVISEENEEIIEGEIIDSTPVSEPHQEVDKETIEKQETNEEKAMNIAKKDYGEKDSIYFSYEGVNNGIHTVTVRDSGTTRTIREYYINIENETFEIVE